LGAGAGLAGAPSSGLVLAVLACFRDGGTRRGAEPAGFGHILTWHPPIWAAYLAPAGLPDR